MELQNQDHILIKTIGTTVSKITLYVCFTIASGMMISTCQVDDKTIIQCEESCGSDRGIKEVTAIKCVCNDIAGDDISPFILPSR